ncbi:hypothetical protein DLAC_08117 [Tieghemostelium lacteum]|uniref:DUF6748 domain-containing protein n=1 Tax=Tieghemostelium lacteum TaxID=361077 RepID=A0A151ZB85_TIELA|nr:hypothetical protein DLAC_08117 [Tieghemostelium lacteum]|eukprot:KYQ91198.1 hypothetical protein DLAC_08117 [Tieghemostelium lacteum]
MFKIEIFLLILVLLLVNDCLGKKEKSSVVKIPEDKEIANDYIPQSSKEYYFISNDHRDCASPACGGFFLKPLNNDLNLGDIYVSEALVINGLDYSHLQSVDTMNEKESNVIVGGVVKPSDTHPGYSCIHISDIFKAMELQLDGTVVNSDMVVAKPSFYMMKSSPIMCGRIGRCAPIATLRLNTNEIGFLQDYEQPYTGVVALLDKVWFKTRLVSNDNHNAISRGYILNDVLHISRVFINIKDPFTPCAKPLATCDHSLGVVPVFTRNTDRCKIFDTCVIQGPCHLMIPHCPEGYSLASVISGPKACPKYYCDPSFLSNTNPTPFGYFKK